jgi:hypothetical protein
MEFLIVMRTFNYNSKINFIHETMESLVKSGLFNSEISYQLHLFDGGSDSLDYLEKYKK